MDVKKIFIILIVIVACVLVGALVLNILLPNVATSLVDAMEDMVYNATGISFDWNGNGSLGSADDTGAMKSDETETAITGEDTVAGWGEGANGKEQG